MAFLSEPSFTIGGLVSSVWLAELFSHLADEPKDNLSYLLH